MPAVPTPPRLPAGHTRETFQAFGRADTRDALMDAMRAQAEAYFGGKVELRNAQAQPAPPRSGTTYQGSSYWTARA